MNIMMIMAVVATALIALLLIIALFMKRGYHVQREIKINVDLESVFSYLKHIRNQDYYNKWLRIDPNMEKSFSGEDGTVGFVYAWNGNKKAGAGEQEILKIIEGEKISMQVRFVRPFAGVANSYMITEAMPECETLVKWGTGGNIKYPMNITRGISQRMLIKDLDESLLRLKTTLEKDTQSNLMRGVSATSP